MLAHPDAKSKFEPPAAARAASLADSSGAVPANLLTECERSAFRDTGGYGEVLDLLQRFARKSKDCRQIEIGLSAEDRPIRALAISAGDPLGDPSGDLSGKPVILIQGAAHAGETAGKDATLMLARDLVLGRCPELLARCVVLVLPVFNPDGHERKSRWRRGNQNGPSAVGSRTTAQGIDLNRSYVKADAPEMQCWLRFYNAWLPHLLIDNHTSNGVDFQYDITYHIQTRQMLWKTVAAWNRTFERALTGRMEGLGHIIGRYFEMESPAEIASGLKLEFRTPGYSWGYASAQHRSAIVAESHSLKSYRTQVWAHYDLMRQAMELVCDDARGLTDAVRRADRDAPRAARIFLDGVFTGKTRQYRFRGLAAARSKSRITGDWVYTYRGEREDRVVPVLDQVKATVAPRVPAAYLIPAAWRRVSDLLRLHGVRVEPLDRSMTGVFGAYWLDQYRWTDTPVAGRRRLEFRCTRVRSRCSAPLGSILVPMNQRAGRLAMNLLEPQGPESLVRLGWFDGIFAQTEYLSDHVMLPIASEMLASDSDLRAGFALALQSDKAFRDSPEARLDFFYRRSKFAEPGRKLYPILRLERR